MQIYLYYIHCWTSVQITTLYEIQVFQLEGLFSFYMGLRYVSWNFVWDIDLGNEWFRFKKKWSDIPDPETPWNFFWIPWCPLKPVKINWNAVKLNTWSPSLSSRNLMKYIKTLFTPPKPIATFWSFLQRLKPIENPLKPPSTSSGFLVPFQNLFLNFFFEQLDE